MIDSTVSSKVIATPAALAAAIAFLFIGYLNVRIDAFPTGAEVGIPEVDVLSAKIKSGARQFLETGARATTLRSPARIPSRPCLNLRVECASKPPLLDCGAHGDPSTYVQRRATPGGALVLSSFPSLPFIVDSCAFPSFNLHRS